MQKRPSSIPRMPSVGNAFNETQVKTLPLEGRNVPDLLILQSGVSYTGNRPDINRDNDTRSGAVNGARSDQSNLTLDGVDVNDQINGYAFTSVLPVTLDSVQEFRVTTTNYGAEEGRSSGAEVSLVTKSGTNSFHGSLYEYLRNTYTSANDFFVKSAEIASGQPNVPPKLNRNVFGGSIGGPIIKDRLYFFLNAEAAGSGRRTAWCASCRATRCATVSFSTSANYWTTGTQTWPAAREARCRVTRFRLATTP